MSEDLFALMPHARRLEIVQPPLTEVPAQTPPQQSLEEVRAIDAAFAGGDEQTEAAMGLMGLCLSAPWLMDVLAEQLRPAPKDDEDEPKRPHLPEKEDA
jgi:hypothetical protein